MLKLRSRYYIAITWACDKLATYILGKKVHIKTDHKPLVPLLSTKLLDNMPPRVLQFHLQVARHDYTISLVPGKYLYTAVTVSRAPITSQVDADANSATVEQAEALMEMCVSHLPASTHRINVYRTSQAVDPTCSTVINYWHQGWPDKNEVNQELIPYRTVRGEQTVHNNLLLRGSRIIVQQPLQKETLQKLHQGHQGIQRCRLRARSCVWWPAIS